MTVLKALGRQNSIGIAKETTRGTTPGSPTFFLAWDEADIEDKVQGVIDNQAQGVIEEGTGQSISKKWSEISVKGPVTDKSFALILLSALGSLSTASNADASGNVKDHTITVAESVQHQSLSFYVDDATATGNAQDYSYALGALKSLELNYEAGKYISYAAAYMAKLGVQGAVTPSTPNENRFMPQHVTFKMASTYAGLGAASAVTVKKLQLKISPNVEDDQSLGDITPTDYLNKSFAIEGTIDATFSDETTFRTLFTGNTAKALRLDIKNTDVTIGTAANPQLTIDLAKCIFTGFSRPWKVGDVIRQTINFKAVYSISDTLMVSVKATNLQASY